jgi:hypothetical protein
MILKNMWGLTIRKYNLISLNTKNREPQTFNRKMIFLETVVGFLFVNKTEISVKR